MKLVKRITRGLRDPWRVILGLEYKGWFGWMSDKTFVHFTYLISTGKWLNLKNPRKYTEKLQWIKLNMRDDRWTNLVDKYEAKKIVAGIIGDEYIIPTLGVYNSFDEIDFDKLPDRFVLKCTHDSGAVALCRNKATFDKTKARKLLELSLGRDYWKVGREWPYKNVKHRIIAEQYMEDHDTGELRDYKFFCFDGKVKALFIATERLVEGEETKFDFFDTDFNHLPLKNGHPNAAVSPAKPRQFELMKQLAARLSKGFPEVRVDFYEVNGKVYFGEMTFFHFGGFVPFEPEEWDYKFGSWMKLPL